MPNFTMQAVAKLPSVSGLSEDVCMNTFTFYGGGSGNTPAIVAAAFHQRVIDYYTDDFGEAHPLGYYLGETLSRDANACSVDWREVTLATGNVGAVVRTDTFTLDEPMEIVNLPRECCLATSFHGDLSFTEEVLPLPPTGPEGDIHPRARLRGRRYIGPLNYGGVADTGGVVRPNSALIGLLILAEDNIAAGGAEVVWSRAGASQAVVTGGWVDNELDTQRRRGLRSTARTTWVA